MKGLAVREEGSFINLVVALVLNNMVGYIEKARTLKKKYSPEIKN
jgi:hypothetical protein